jgi:aminoglycoside phosphotransferase (APT) family kinase protein
MTPGLEPVSLERWLSAYLPGAHAPFEYRLIAGGHSNITYRVEDARGSRFVLRRPPLGIQPPGAHDVAREYRIQAALRPTNVPVPYVELLCEDTSVIGAPFYVMRWVDGTVVDSPSCAAAILPTAPSRRRAADSVIETLADLHRLDVDALGLGSLGPRNGFLARQTERMSRVWAKIKTRELPLIESLHGRLVRQCPPQRYTGLVHNDYRLGNLMLDGGNRVAAVLDWELTAIGDVLADLGALLNNWDGPEEPGPDIWMQPAPTRAGGFPTRSELVSGYARLSGFDVSDLDYYRALSYWRIAIIGEGMMRRYESGEMPAERADLTAIDRRVRDRAELADKFLRAFVS